MWSPPEAMADLDLDPADYPRRFITFEQIVAHIKGLSFKLNTPQHSIRRYEFDDFLLERSGAEVHRRNVKNIRRENGHYVVGEEFRCDYLVGAGGTRCPVYRSLFRERNPRAKELQATTFEHEFPFEWEDPRCHLWFFDKGLPGYAWYVPKEKGWLNCGIGGMAEKLKARGADIKTHWRHFTEVLRRQGFVVGADYAPRGYSYYLRGDVDVVRIDNAFITGDAAGLATRDLCEGIGPRHPQRGSARRRPSSPGPSTAWTISPPSAPTTPRSAACWSTCSSGARPAHGLARQCVPAPRSPERGGVRGGSRPGYFVSFNVTAASPGLRGPARSRDPRFSRASPLRAGGPLESKGR